MRFNTFGKITLRKIFNFKKMAVRETKCKMNFYSAQMKQANSSNGQIGNIEAGKAFPSFELILRIADAFSIHPADLFLRDSSKIQDRKLYSKYHELLLNCEHLPECHKQIVNQLVKSLAESTIEYKTSHK